MIVRTPDRISIIIVTAGREALLQNCLRTIQNCERPFETDVIVVLNGVGETIRIPEEFKLPVKVIRCEATSPAGARNLALAVAEGEFICFLDDDVSLPPGYFMSAWKLITENPDTVVIGGPDATPTDAGLLERAIGISLQSPLATASTRLRHGAGTHALAKADEKKLILCNLWVRRTLFTDLGMRFDERFVRNEENVLLHQLGSRPLLFSSRLFLYHRRKTQLIAFCKAVFLSGFFRAQSFFIYPGSVSAIFFVPSATLLAFVLLIFCSLQFALYFAAVYAIVNLAFALTTCSKAGNFAVTPLVAFYQLLINVAYAIGFMGGLTSPVKRVRHSTRTLTHTITKTQEVTRP